MRCALFCGVSATRETRPRCVHKLRFTSQIRQNHALSGETIQFKCSSDHLSMGGASDHHASACLDYRYNTRPCMLTRTWYAAGGRCRMSSATVASTNPPCECRAARRRIECTGDMRVDAGCKYCSEAACHGRMKAGKDGRRTPRPTVTCPRPHLYPTHRRPNIA